MRWVLVVAAVMRPCHLHRRRVLLRRQPLPLFVVCHLLHGRCLIARGLLVMALAGVSRLLRILFHLFFQIFVCFGFEEGVHGLKSVGSRTSRQQVILEEVLLVDSWLVNVLVLLHLLRPRCLLLPLGCHRLGTQPGLHIYHGLAALSAADYRGRSSRVQRCLV